MMRNKEKLEHYTQKLNSYRESQRSSRRPSANGSKGQPAAELRDEFHSGFQKYYRKA